MAGTVDIVQRCYLGVEMRDDVLWLNPALPAELQSFRTRMRFRGHWVGVEVDRDALSVTFEPSRMDPARVGFRGEIHTLHQGETRRFRLPRRGRARGTSS
jgi:trehalose/maltose hydrolase-like predicted phosphorylase